MSIMAVLYMEDKISQHSTLSAALCIPSFTMFSKIWGGDIDVPLRDEHSMVTYSGDFTYESQDQLLLVQKEMYVAKFENTSLWV